MALLPVVLSFPPINHPIPLKSSPPLSLSLSLSHSHSHSHSLPNHIFPGPKPSFVEELARRGGKSSRIARCSSKPESETENQKTRTRIVKEKSVSVILLAGGKGKRMGASMPKQYLPLLGQPIALYSFYTFSRLIEVKEIIVVCDPSYKDIFEGTKENIHVELKFTLPGKERQDSVYSGLQAVDLNSELVCVHDSARPLVSSGDTEKVLKDGWLNGAAVLGVPVKATIKEVSHGHYSRYVPVDIKFYQGYTSSAVTDTRTYVPLVACDDEIGATFWPFTFIANSESFVVRTLDRKTLWEMQTPQVIKPELLKKGFELVNREGLEVTDDVSIVEHLKHPVYISEGSYTNIKVTTPDDLLLAERILSMSPGESS